MVDFGRRGIIKMVESGTRGGMWAWLTGWRPLAKLGTAFRQGKYHGLGLRPRHRTDGFFIPAFISIPDITKQNRQR